MKTTVGITFPRLSREPLMTEGEATAGDDHANPYRSVEEREYVERVRQKERDRRDAQLWKSGMDIDPDSIEWVASVESPTSGSNPYAFDDIDSDSFDLPTLDFDGPKF